MGTDPIIRTSQLQTNQVQFDTLISTQFGCPIAPGPDNGYTCQGGARLPLGTFKQNLSPVPGTNWVLRMSTGIELQTMLPVVNAPFRIYYAYNALRLDSSATPPLQINRGMFPCPDPRSKDCTDKAAGDYTYQLTKATLGSNYTLREPRKTIRFSVATTF
jgi:outer membrane protein insertion porin family